LWFKIIVKFFFASSYIFVVGKDENLKKKRPFTLAIKGMYTNPYTPLQVAQAKARITGKSFANFLEPLASAVWHKDINRKHPAPKAPYPPLAERGRILR